jgi:hypothetical protein
MNVNVPTIFIKHTNDSLSTCTERTRSIGEGRCEVFIEISNNDTQFKALSIFSRTRIIL